MGLELCSYCLAEGPLLSIEGIGKLCEICVESYISDLADKYQSRHLNENKKQEAIKPTATKEIHVKINNGSNTIH